MAYNSNSKDDLPVSWGNRHRGSPDAALRQKLLDQVGREQRKQFQDLPTKVHSSMQAKAGTTRGHPVRFGDATAVAASDLQAKGENKTFATPLTTTGHKLTDVGHHASHPCDEKIAAGIFEDAGHADHHSSPKHNRK